MVRKVSNNEYKYCDRCNKRFTRRRDIWNIFYGQYTFCHKCRKSFNEWWDNYKNEKPLKKEGYYCKLCQLYHYPGSKIFHTHKEYIANRRRIIKKGVAEELWDNKYDKRWNKV